MEVRVSGPLQRIKRSCAEMPVRPGMLSCVNSTLADFFDGKHFVLRGSSPVTHSALRRDSFRNFYQRSYPYVFAKFRLCFDAAPAAGADAGPQPAS